MAFTKEQRLINQVSGSTKQQRNEKKEVSMTGSFNIPNKSGDHMRSIKRDAPVNSYDLVNKDYVDTTVGSYIKKDGTSTTTGKIPFAYGLKSSGVSTAATKAGTLFYLDHTAAGVEGSDVLWIGTNDTASLSVNAISSSEQGKTTVHKNLDVTGALQQDGVAVFNNDTKIAPNKKLYFNSGTDDMYIFSDDTHMYAKADTGGINFEFEGFAKVQFDSPVNVGVNDTGHDVKMFGATSGKYWLWDESADSMIVNGKTSLIGDIISKPTLNWSLANNDPYIIFKDNGTSRLELQKHANFYPKFVSPSAMYFFANNGSDACVFKASIFQIETANGVTAQVAAYSKDLRLTTRGTGGDVTIEPSQTPYITCVDGSDEVTIEKDLKVEGDVGFYGTSPVAQTTGYTTFSNLSTDRTLDADSTTTEEVADVLGTLIEDLKATGIISA